ncbi:MAG: cation:proton antiporter, partial [Bryobacteraceae bacterium]|nr:cation:proton antiporter [Bryobacteraceae bacterium]
YESIYSLGVAFAAFAAAEAFHGSGFLAAFAAGLTISALDVELCDCFLEYGETTAEMALLFTFVMLGTSVIWSGFQIASPMTLGFTVVVFLARPVAFTAALLPAQTPWKSRALIAWFGPRGLSSLLLILLPVFSGLREARQLIPICSLVVLCSVVIHGFSPVVVFRRKSSARTETTVMPEVLTIPRVAETAVQFAEPGYITIAEYEKAREGGVPTAVVDARTGRTFSSDDLRPADSVRFDPEKSSYEIRRLSIAKDTVLVALCA